ncbi:MAG TPA: hypothetical protein P5048_03290 [Chlamydiales bacterium]|mgnify:CR=1 FL=1|nr:hypothetical protein [Chlamydiales bacterium]
MHTKAYYNSLFFSPDQKQLVPKDFWKVEDLRLVSIAELFERLKAFNIHLDRKSFSLYVDEAESPETLVDFFANKEDENYDPIYLIVFELWRRLHSSQKTLSIFCDELDRRIYDYDQGVFDSDEKIQDSLLQLEAILDENAEEGDNPHNLFHLLSDYMAHDLESFLYDYILEQIDEDQDLYAQDLIQAFYPYIPDVKWFDILRLRLFEDDMEEQKDLFQDLLNQALNKEDVDFQLELLKQSIYFADQSSFMELLKQSVPFLQTEKDFQDLLEIAAEYFHRLDKEELEKQILQLIAKRIEHDEEEKLCAKDEGISSFQKMIF